MFHRKPVLVIAVAAAVGTLPALASAASITTNSDFELYGRAHLSIDSLSDGDDYSELNMSSNSSRLGFKGSTDFGDLTGIFQIEQQIDFNHGNDDETFTGRDTFAGVKGDFGMVRLGEFDTPFKRARGPANFFGDQVGDMRNLTRVGDGRFDERTSNTLHYQTPDMNGLQVNLAYALHEGGDAGDGDDETSTSLSVTYSDGPLSLAVATESHGEETGDEERSGNRLAVSYQVMPALTVGGFYQTIDHDDDAHDSDVLGFGGAYQLADATYLRGHYFMRDADADDWDSTLMAVGVEHRIDSALRFYANYATVDNDDNSDLTPWGQARTTGTDGAAGETATAVSLGMRYDF